MMPADGRRRVNRRNDRTCPGCGKPCRLEPLCKRCLIAEGLRCRNCVAPPAPGHRYCRDHLEHFRYLKGVRG